ncbi:hypothetical protein BEP19_16785 [Ammoniphilus oxalaticus]|uniref:Uncharacterized protein n=2 Tax=Ammoniphilus oxalaticus TaxID=66863 RepID=A0A419SQB6_9BACL|nr:hypothetical protein BEP19_16785 [Ammoniphilus oxalaticus]
MLHVLFFSVDDPLIPNHTRLDFPEAVKLTDELETKCREEKRVMTSRFVVISTETDLTFYDGSFQFGSYEAPNIYQQIKKISERIKVSKKDQADKTYFLEQIEALTPESYKKEEIIDKELIHLDKSRISKLKTWQRRVVYATAALSIAALGAVSTIFIAQKAQYEQALGDGRDIVEDQKGLIDIYETALLGNKEGLEAYLQGEALSEKQQHILVDMYLKAEDYDQAVAVLEDPVQVETYILNSESWEDQEKINKLKAFNELYPTNEARFDMAFYEHNYELMLNLPPINMTAKRSRMKTYALMRLGKIEEAKIEINHNNDDNLKRVIDRYEVLQAEIKTLTEKLEREQQANGKDPALIQTLTEELAKKKEALAAL